MQNQSLLASLLVMVSALLSACGGGGGGTTADTTAPTITSVSASAPNSSQITLSAVATDNTAVTGYCFKTSATKPASTDSCFASSTSLTLAVPGTPILYYVWTKDSANNISAGFERVVGPCSAAGVAASQASVLPTVCVLTTLGEFVLALESAKAPITTTNFLKYVNDGFYSQTIFHRVMSNFVVQGGGFTGVPITSSANLKTPTYPAIVLEPTTATGLSNTTGTIAMARTTEFNSATSQFYVNVVDNTGLDGAGGYAAFGRVISGLATTIEAIRTLPVQDNGSGQINQPVTPPSVQWAYQLK
jgi:peptidyl-prolyl cis-trans isomerase A (cyclophilin A)